jgi:hypothetical protein
MIKKIALTFIAVALALPAFSAHVSAQAQHHLHVAIAYGKGNHYYNIVVQAKPGEELAMYVNDNHATKAGVNGKGWATFNSVELVDAGKISFTKILKTQSGNSYQNPINFTEHFSINSGQATFTTKKVPLHIAIAYSKGNGDYDVVVHGNYDALVDLYVNNQNPKEAKVNNQDWATFRGVSLNGVGKISFTRVYDGTDGATSQVPINFTEHYSVSGSTVTFSLKAPPKPKLIPKPAAVVSHTPTTVTTPTSVKTTPVPSTAPKPSPKPASCHPLTNGGNCYEPGEYCRNTDHGVSGIAGDGKSIVCEDNNGWRWEP